MFDYISMLKNFNQQNVGYDINYDWTNNKIEHSKIYKCVYRLGEREIGEGSSTCKQEAKRFAAEEGVRALRREGHEILNITTPDKPS